MIGRVKEFAVDYTRRTVRRFVIRGAVGLLSVGALVGYRAMTGQPLWQAAADSVAADVAAGDSAAPADTMRTVALQGSAPAAAPAPVAAPVAPQGSTPDINAPKRAAQRAADATNAATAAKTGQEVPAPGGAAAQRSGPGSVPATPAAPAAAPAPVANVPAVTREVFSYSADGRRDPFFSLILTEDLRPLLSDLKLVGILWEGSGRRSVAIMRDIQTNAQYRVGPGQTLGRMRVTQIKPKGVIFSIDEFGLSRQDSLVMTDTTKVRN